MAGEAAAVLYLASKSPQRAMLLTSAGIPFTAVASACDEDAIAAADPAALALARARGKAAGAVGVPAGGSVLGADTVVALGDEVLGSPATHAQAAAFLARLSGTRHRVHTGHCLRRGGVERCELASAEVEMRRLTPEEIRAYAASGEGLGKAGGYAIQAEADRFARITAGAWDTVVGLHVAAVRRLMAGLEA